MLIPHQNGQPVNFRVVSWYLAAWRAAAVLAWLLGWGRTFVMAWVSERIAADLRNADLRPFATSCRWNFSAASGPAT